jgi:hypothetical protein
MNYDNIATSSKWGDEAAKINNNFSKTDVEILALQGIAGGGGKLFKTLDEVKAAYTSPTKGLYALVSSTLTFPATVYQYDGTQWVAGGTSSGGESVSAIEAARDEALTEISSTDNILVWKTDAATTRLQVPSAKRKSGLIISYKNNSSVWVNEQYIGTTFDDTSFSSSSNWKAVGENLDIVQETGEATDAVMSQKAVTGELSYSEISDYVLSHSYGYQDPSGVICGDGTDTGWWHTDFIPIVAGSDIVVTKVYAGNSNVAVMALFDADKKFISGTISSIENQTFNYPSTSNVKYVRFSSESKDSSLVFSMKKTTVLTLKESINNNSDKIKVLGENIKSNADNIAVNSRTINAMKIFDLNVLKDEKFGQCTAAGSTVNGNEWISQKTSARRRVVKTIKTLQTTTAGTGYIIIGKPSADKTSVTITSRISFDIAAGVNEIDLTEKQIIVEPGYCVGFGGDLKYITAWDASGDGVYGWYSSIFEVGKNYSVLFSNDVYDLTVELTVSELNSFEDYFGDNKVNVNNAANMIIFGSSYTEGIYQPMGFNWMQRINDMVDINLINYGQSGKPRINNIQSVYNNDTLRFGGLCTIKDVNPQYLLFGNSANFSENGETGYAELKQALTLAKSFGAKMIISDEEIDFYNYTGLNSSFARENNINVSSG